MVPVCIIQIDWLLQDTKMIAVYSEIRTKSINTLRLQNAVARRVTTVILVLIPYNHIYYFESDVPNVFWPTT